MAIDRFKLQRVVLHIACFYPFAAVLFLVLTDPSGAALGPDPGEYVVDHSGWWAFMILCLTLLMRPLHVLWPKQRFLSYRRALGLWSFFYVLIHLLGFSTFIALWNWSYLAVEITARPYIWFGFSAFLVLIPLVFTSTKASMKRLGKRWQRLHNLVYLAAFFAVIHFALQVRASWQEFYWPGLLLVALLLYRLYRYWKRRIA
jgi:sulfoxide reductase heme-binding subunit YedZ